MADVSEESKKEHDEMMSKTFASEDAGFNFYNSYALKKGFSVRRSYVEWDGANEEIILRKFVCSREGCREEKHMKRKREDRKRRPRNITRVGCKAKLVIARAEETGQWSVKHFIGEHNHDLAPGDLACLLRSHRRISDEQKADIIEMESAGVRKHKIMDVLRMTCGGHGGYDKVGCTTRDIYNYCHQYKQETVADGDAQTVIRHMMAREERDPGFFFRYLVDDDGRLKGLFWSDSQSRLDYEAFGDVVVFDSTYRTNKYNLPFVPFVGLNHHRSTVIFGCGIISHETTAAYEWMLQVFTEAMSQKHPISVITDGDLAMQRAIRVIWPHSTHKLCVWHIQQNIVRHLSDDKVKEEFRSFIYDSCSIAEHEIKWLDFLERNKVTSEESWLHQMYQMRKLWCAPYLAGRCFLGLSSNQRSESLNSVLHTHLSSQMTLFKMVEHFERCLLTRRLNELVLNIVCLQSVPFTEPDASSLEKHAAMAFTPCVFQIVRYSIDAASKCFISSILDGWELDGSNLVTYVVAKKDRREKKFEVRRVEKEGSPYRISCSCRKLECLGTPCSHILHVLGKFEEKQLPSCCVPTRWTMSARGAYTPSRKSGMYDYSKSLVRYRELRKRSHAACFRSCHSDEAFHRLMMLLDAQDDIKEPTNDQNERIRFGPVLPLTEQTIPGKLGKVLDPEHVKGRGAPKKRLQAKMKKPRSKGKCGYCGEEGHNIRTCEKFKEKNKLREQAL